MDEFVVVGVLLFVVAKNSDPDTLPISDGIIQAYATAESLRLFLIELKQKYITDKDNANDGAVNVNPIELMNKKAMFLLKFAGLSKVVTKPEKPAFGRQLSKNKTAAVCDAETEQKIETAFQKFPSFRLVLEFVRDAAWSSERVEQLLKERSLKAKAIANVYNVIEDFVRSVTADNVFQIPVVVLLQELLQYQGKIGNHYADGLDGCGLELESRVRDAYYVLLRTFIGAIRAAPRSSFSRNYLSLYDFFVASTLHLLDMNWQIYDLPFLEETKLVELYHSLSVDNLVTLRVESIARDDEAEMKKYEESMKFIEEAKKGKAFIEMDPAFRSQYCWSSSLEYPGIYKCDSCKSSIWFSRYRCLECKERDICETCFVSGTIPVENEHTAEHHFAHFRYKCTGCSGYILGTRFHCTVCQDVDLCTGCWKNSVHPPSHKQDHNMQEYEFKKYIHEYDSVSRLQPYIHQHARMMFSSLALTATAMLFQRQLSDADYIKAASAVYRSSVELCLSDLGLIADNQPKESNQYTFVNHLYRETFGTLCRLIPEADETPLSESTSKMLLDHNLITHLLELIQKQIFQGDDISRLAFFTLQKLLQNAPDCKTITDGLLRTDEDSDSHPVGLHTVKFLCNLGVSYLEKRNMTWFGYVVRLVQRLYHSSGWRSVVVQASCITQHTKKCSPMSVLVGYIIAGFPDIVSVGSVVSQKDSDVDQRFGVVVELCDAKEIMHVLEKKTRKERKKHFFRVNEIVKGNDNCVTSSQIPHFISFVEDFIEKLQSGEQVDEYSVWTLSLVLKALTQSDQHSPEFFREGFLKNLVHLATSATDLSKHWTLSDLELLNIKLHNEHDWRQVKQEEEVVVADPLDGLDEETRDRFIFIQEAYGMSLPLIRTYYEEFAKQDLDELLNVIAETVGETKQKFDDGFVDSGVHFSSECAGLADSESVEECVECPDSEADLAEPEGEKKDNEDAPEEETEQEQIPLESNSSRLLKKELAGDRDKSPDHLLKVVRAIAILYARKVMLHLLANWPLKDSTIAFELASICTSENLPHLLDLIKPMGTTELFAKAVKTLVKQWPHDGLQRAALVACNFMKSLSSTTITCESTDCDDSGEKKMQSRINIPGADFLNVEFDTSCSSTDGILIISSSEDFTSAPKEFGGQKNQWHNTQVPGATLFYKYSTKDPDAEYFFKFSVTAGRLGDFETGHVILKSLLGIPTVVSAMSLGDIWRRLINVACLQSGKMRLQSIELLLCLLNTLSRDDVRCTEKDFNLALVAPLWRLNEKIVAENPSSRVVSSLRQALIELFFRIEQLALDRNIVEEYLLDLSSGSGGHIQKVITQGLENVASVSLGIAYQNCLTKEYSQR